MIDQQPEKEVFAGVDTHTDTHHAAVVDPLGRPVADREFPTTTQGYRALLTWLILVQSGAQNDWRRVIKRLELPIRTWRAGAVEATVTDWGITATTACGGAPITRRIRRCSWSRMMLKTPAADQRAENPKGSCRLRPSVPRDQCRASDDAGWSSTL